MGHMPWRLILSPPGRGALNMAIDEAVMDAVARGDSPPTLRLYSWSAPCLSVGYGQRGVQALAARCARAGVGLVRRITGGRAVLHHIEVTYAISAPVGLRPEFTTVSESYRLFGECLRLGLAQVGIQCTLGERPPRGGGRPRDMCFALAIGGDLRAGNAKVAGSAQARRDGTLLQQGSLPLVFDWGLQAAVFGEEAEAAHVEGSVVGAADLLAGGVSHERMCQALARGFATVLGELRGQGLTSAEMGWAGELASRKYGSQRWNLEGPAAHGRVDVRRAEC